MFKCKPAFAASLNWNMSLSSLYPNDFV